MDVILASFDEPENIEEKNETLRQFSSDAAKELLRGVNNEVVFTVLQRLMRQTVSDIELIIVDEKPPLHVPDDFPQNKAEAGLPHHPTYSDLQIAARLLDYHWQLGGNRSGLDDFGYWYDLDFILHLSALLHKKYGDDAHDVANLLFAQGWRYMHTKEHGEFNLPLFIERGEDGQSSLKKNIIAQADSKPRDFNESDFNFLHCLIEPDLAAKLGIRYRKKRKKEKDANHMEHVLNKIENLLVHRKIYREKALIALQGFRIQNEAMLAIAIARQGYRTFANMDEMTEYDSWGVEMDRIRRTLRSDSPLLKPKEELIKKAVSQLHQIIETVKKHREERLQGDPLAQKRHEEIVKKAGDPLHQATSEFQSEADERLWSQAEMFFALNDPAPRRKLREVLRCDEYKNEMQKLEEMGSWFALGAKEREFVNRVYSEVVRFGYEHDTHGGVSYKDTTFIAGAPAYTEKHRKVNCFTAPWFIAALCLEGGIKYQNMSYCNSLMGSSNATHGMLLIRFSDGGAILMDPGSYKASTHFKTKFLEKRIAQAELIDFFAMSEGRAKGNHKPIGVVKDIRLSKEAAELMGIHRHIHLMPLDQGFASVSLLHAGMALRREEKFNEAMQAFEFGLVMYPNNPDLLAQMATIEIDRGNNDRAKRFVQLALDAFEHHLLALYLGGVIALREGDNERAEQYFMRVGTDPRASWGVDHYRHDAKAYLDLLAQHQTLECEFGKTHEGAVQEGLAAGYVILTPVEKDLPSS
jgi:hypothetical protein